MITEISRISKAIMQDFFELNGEVFSAKRIEDWTMRVIVSVAFGNSLSNQWMATKFQEFTGTFVLIESNQ